MLPATLDVHTVLVVVVHAPLLATAEPASHVVHVTQFELPSTLQFTPAVHCPRTITAISAAAATASGSRREGAIRGGTGRQGAGEAGEDPKK